MLYIVGYLHLVGYTSFDIDNAPTRILVFLVLGTFVFVSGYLLGNWQGGLNRKDLARFYARRLLRIYPLYLFSLLLFGLFYLADWGTVARAALLISMLQPPAPATLWFISMLLLFYLTAPFLICATPRGRLVRTGAILMGLLCFHWLVNPIDTRILMYFPPFVLGIHCRTRPGTSGSPTVKRWASLGLLGGLPLYFLDNTMLAPYALAQIPMILGGALWLFHLSSHASTISLGASGLIRQLAYASFCMYLTHRIIFLFLKLSYWPDGGPGQLLWFVCLGLPLIALISWLLQWICDYLLGLMPFLTPPKNQSGH